MAREESSHGVAVTRRRIIEAVTALITDEHPATLSVPAVARRAGVSVATVYRYFPNKGALLDAATVIGNEKTAAHFAGRRLDHRAVDDLVARTFWELADHLPLARAQARSETGRDLRRRRRPAKQQVLRAAVAELGLDPDDPASGRLMTLIELLASSTALIELHDHLGLAVDDAAAHIAWAIRALTDATALEAGRS